MRVAAVAGRVRGIIAAAFFANSHDHSWGVLHRVFWYVATAVSSAAALVHRCPQALVASGPSPMGSAVTTCDHRSVVQSDHRSVVNSDHRSVVKSDPGNRSVVTIRDTAAVKIHAHLKSLEGPKWVTAGFAVMGKAQNG